jgi:hypothetical protein
MNKVDAHAMEQAAQREPAQNNPWAGEGRNGKLHNRYVVVAAALGEWPLRSEHDNDRVMATEAKLFGRTDGIQFRAAGRQAVHAQGNPQTARGSLRGFY